MQPSLFNNPLGEITELERTTLIPLIVDILALTHIDNILPAKNIAIHLTKAGHPTSDARVRKMISCISGVNLKQGKETHLGEKVVIGTVRGYFVTDSLEDCDKHIEWLQKKDQNLVRRIDSVKAQRENLKHKRA